MSGDKAFIDTNMIEQLKAYVEEKQLHKKALECFWIAFNNWKSDYPKSYSEKFSNIPLEALEVFVHSIGLRSSEWPRCDYNHVTVTVLVHYRDDEGDDHALADYVAWFSLSADVDDDDFLDIY